MPEIEKIDRFLQFVLDLREQGSTTAVEAAQWLHAVGLLKDSESRPGNLFVTCFEPGRSRGRGRRQRPLVHRSRVG